MDDENIEETIGKLNVSLNAIDEAAAQFSPQAATLAGDLRDLFMERFRNAQQPWHLMSEAEQTDFDWLLFDLCKEVAVKTVEVVASKGWPTITVGLDELNFKKDGKIAAKLSVPEVDIDVSHLLVDARGSKVMIVCCEPSLFLGQRAARRPNDQQPDLPLGPEQKVEADIDTIIAGDEREPSAGQIGDGRAQRREAELDPYAAGYSAAVQGRSPSKNPLDLGSEQSASWMHGYRDGVAAGLDAPRMKARRRNP